MNRRGMVAALCVLFVNAAAVWAAVCPLCLQEIPDGEKYCFRHKAEIAAKQSNSKQEQALVADLKASREAYTKKLEDLEKFYTDRGDAQSLEKVRAELQDLRQARIYTESDWEDGLSLNPKDDVADAAALLAKAEDARSGINPFRRAERYRQAAEYYQEILTKYPNSKVAPAAAFGMGELYSSSSVGEYKRAVRFFEIAYESDPSKQQDALMKAAKICDDDLANYEEACRFYWLAAKVGTSMVDRKTAEIRLKEIQSKGFGSKYVLETAPAAKPAEPAPAK